MSRASAQEIKEQIQQSVDIVDLVGKHIDLRRQGRQFVGLCPWHDDSRPSLQVNPERQTWKCWVCNVGGDIFSFVMQRERVEFREALQILAEQAGIQLQTSGGPAAGGAEKQTLYSAMAWAEQQFHECLLQSPLAESARGYLTERGISLESIHQYRLGFAPDQWQWLLDRARSTPYSESVLEGVGLVARSPQSGRCYDRFKGRVLFPIRDAQRRPVALGGRILPELSADQPAKYINSPETRLFSKSDLLYGLDVVRDTLARQKQLVVVEGYTDAVIAWQFGLLNVAAVLGTALGPRHIQLLRRLGADRVILVLDGDEAGRRRASEILELFVGQPMDLRIVTIPDQLDPCDFILQRGAEAFQGLLDASVDALEHKIQLLTVGVDLLRDTHRSQQALEELLRIMARAPRVDDADGGVRKIRQQQLLARLARMFHLEDTEVRGRFAAMRRGSMAATSRRTPMVSTATSAGASAERLSPFESELLEILLLDPSRFGPIAEALELDDLIDPAVIAIYQICRERHHRHESLDFEQLLLAIDDASHKLLLVRMDEEARSKGTADLEMRCHDLLDGIAQRRELEQRRHRLAELDQDHLSEQQELAILQQHFQRLRKRHGISAPTDG